MFRTGIVALVGLAGVGCDAPGPAEARNVLTGSVTVGGQPAQFGMIAAVGPGGAEASGPRLADGSYQIVNPPTGLLKFKFAAGPPVPEFDTTKAGTGNVPKKYLTADTDLQFDYKGGSQKYDIALKP